MLADIFTANTELAEWFLIFAILFGVLSVLAAAPVVVLPKLNAWAAAFLALSVGLIASALLVL